MPMAQQRHEDGLGKAGNGGRGMWVAHAKYLIIYKKAKGLPGRSLDYKFLFSVEGLVLIRLYFDWSNSTFLAVMELTS